MSVPGRSCGDCSLCCKLLGVAELDKPQNVWCQHLVRANGCGIYETRPDACRRFYCRWMKDPNMGPHWKPDKSKMVLAHLAEHQLSVYVDAGASGAWRREPYFSHLVAMARTGLKNNAILKIIERGGVFVLLPDRVVDLGMVKPDEEILLIKRPVPGGFTYEVSVRRSE